MNERLSPVNPDGFPNWLRPSLGLAPLGLGDDTAGMTIGIRTNGMAGRSRRWYGNVN